MEPERMIECHRAGLENVKAVYNVSGDFWSVLDARHKSTILSEMPSRDNWILMFHWSMWIHSHNSDRFARCIADRPLPTLAQIVSEFSHCTCMNAHLVLYMKYVECRDLPFEVDFDHIWTTRGRSCVAWTMLAEQLNKKLISYKIDTVATAGSELHFTIQSANNLLSLLQSVSSFILSGSPICGIYTIQSREEAQDDVSALAFLPHPREAMEDYSYLHCLIDWIYYNSVTNDNWVGVLDSAVLFCRKMVALIDCAEDVDTECELLWSTMKKDLEYAFAMDVKQAAHRADVHTFSLLMRRAVIAPNLVAGKQVSEYIQLSQQLNAMVKYEKEY